MNERDIAGMERLEAHLEALVQSLGPAGRKKLFVSLGRTLLTINRRRIAANQTPEGGKMTPRKGEARKKRTYRRMGIIYRKLGAQKARFYELKSVRDDDGSFAAYSVTSGGIRTFVRDDRMRTILFSEPGGDATKKRRNKHMFLRLRLARWLKLKASPEFASIYFQGGAGAIATTHHHGLRDKVSENSTKEVDYPARPLLGLSDTDRNEIENIILEHFSKEL
jgi:phage gpG-like protein